MVSSAYNCRRGTRLLRLQNPICSSDFHHPVWSAGMINICNNRRTVKTEEKRFFTSLHHSRFKSQRRKCERHVLSRNPLCERCCVFRLHSRLVSLYRECLCLPDSHCIHSPPRVSSTQSFLFSLLWLCVLLLNCCRFSFAFALKGFPVDKVGQCWGEHFEILPMIRFPAMMTMTMSFVGGYKPQ